MADNKDKDRDRDRDRDKRDRDRSDRGDRNDRDRDRSDRGERSDRDRDRDRDRRGDRDRDRGGDRERDRGGDRERDRGGDRDYNRYNNRDRKRSRSPGGNRSSGGYGPPSNVTTSPTNGTVNQQSNSAPAPAATQNSRKSSLWDRPPDPNDMMAPVGQVYGSQALQQQHPNYQLQQHPPQSVQHHHQQQIMMGLTSYSGVAGHNSGPQAPGSTPPQLANPQHMLNMNMPNNMNMNPLAGNNLNNNNNNNMPSLQSASAALAAKQSRRLYVGNIPPNVTEAQLVEFFNAAIIAAALTTKPGQPVLLCQITAGKSFAFIEFRSSEEATLGMGLDGISLSGFALKIRRPKDYQAVSNEPVPTGLSIVSTNVPDSENKIFIGGLPPSLNEEQIKSMLSGVGKLKAFNLVKDTKTGVSKGFAFCEYLDPENTDRACAELNGTKFGDKSLLVQKASLGKEAIANNFQAVVNPSRVKVDPSVSSLLNLTTALPQVLGAIRSNVSSDNNSKPSRVVQLLNMTDKEEIQDDNNYENLLLDTKEACEEFGEVESIYISRPKDTPLDIIKVFVCFVQPDSAQKAWVGLGGRKYNYRTIITAFYPEDLYIIEGNNENYSNDSNGNGNDYNMEMDQYDNDMDI